MSGRRKLPLIRKGEQELQSRKLTLLTWFEWESSEVTLSMADPLPERGSQIALRVSLPLSVKRSSNACRRRHV